jgi:hypothetical protein
MEKTLIVKLVENSYGKSLALIENLDGSNGEVKTFDYRGTTGWAEWAPFFKALQNYQDHEFKIVFEGCSELLSEYEIPGLEHN